MNLLPVDWACLRWKWRGTVPKTPRSDGDGLLSVFGVNLGAADVEFISG